MTNALILSGGGARAAYQVGVLMALKEILPSLTRNPFPVICGTSAGAINALALATHAGSFDVAVTDLQAIWQNINIHRIFNSGWTDIGKSLARVGFSLFHQGNSSNGPLALLDNSPLRDFLKEHIHFEHIPRAIAAGDLRAVSVTAMGYSSGESVAFFQGDPALNGWRRSRRVGVPADLTVDHLMASSAIPTIFPAVRINREYFGDGAVRQFAPISPALHLGADRIFVIGVSGNRNPVHWGKRRIVRHSPSMGQIVGHLFNSAFIDSLEGDLEHLERINELLMLIPENIREASEVPLRPVECLTISPSKELDRIAGRKIRYLPKSMRFFLRSTGSTTSGGGAAAASYLLFAQPFCDELIELGYQDAMWEQNAIQAFFQV